MRHAAGQQTSDSANKLLMATYNRLEAIHTHLQRSADLARATADACASDLSTAVDLILECYRNGGKLLLCGNGGSAAHCQHFAAEMVNVLSRQRPRPALAAIALTADSSLLTAIANDFGFPQIFARQVEALGKRGDVLLGLTTSGDSSNLIRAFEVARARGISTLLLTREGGGRVLPLADVAVRVPSDDVQSIQEMHVALGHCICAAVEQALFPPG